MRRITEKGLELIKKYEGFRQSSYICPAGLPTIGYGHVIRKGEEFPESISKEQGTQLLMQDVSSSEGSVLRLVKVPLTDGQFDALVSFTFNLGAGAFQRSTLRQKINRGEHNAAPKEFMKWIYAGPRILPGLIKRRREEGMVYIS